MLLENFDFDLPERLVAQYPLPNREDAKLLSLDNSKGTFDDSFVSALPDYLGKGDLLVMNNTKVVPARLFGRKATGGAVEIFVERVLSGGKVLVRLRANRPCKVNDRIDVLPFGGFVVVGRDTSFYTLMCHSADFLEKIFKRSGHVPLPPYIKRADTALDVERYQTLFASESGSVAAPTAGLHITEGLLVACKKKSVEIGFLTLHIGAGTYTPIKTHDINKHQMHGERLVVTKKLCEQINAVKLRGGKIFAVGTTVLRALETIARTEGEIRPYSGETKLFIRPGFRFNIVDCLFTNFHMPKSSLFVLLGAFGGLDLVREAYKYAVKEQYRFYSYGDAMLIPRNRAD